MRPVGATGEGVRVFGGLHLFLHGQFPAADQVVAALCVLFWWVWFFLFFLVSVYGRPKRLKSWDTGMWAPQVEPDAPTQGLHQARIFGHAVKQAPLLQEVRRGAALPDFSFVQDDHPARGGDTDVSGGEGVGTSCPQEPT